MTIAMKRKTTKDKILEVLKKENRSSIKDLADHILISEVAIRRHINDMLRRGFVREEEVRQEIGRPYFVYSLTKEGHQTFPNQYEEMPVEFLQDVEALYGKEAVVNVLKQRKKREQAELLACLEEKDFDEKVVELVGQLENKGYMVDYTKSETGDYQIHNFHCPIFNVASKYNIVCDNEREMYKKLFPDSNVTDLCCMSRGSNQCHWTITNPNNKNNVQSREKVEVI